MTSTDTNEQPKKSGLMGMLRGGLDKVTAGLSDPSSLQHTM